ncbi:hypothetical protein Tsubulata_037607 [Turnera subulata]|uniref:F-box domain-containing protein n=1 Tax=Turnera subulata TaxID=218843 RepID=A0A9Q0FHA0_9ROSI|nr:hypothetical protein Tsubulata_037607 [Turnera subulata]
MDRRKRPRISRKPTTKSDLFDQFPDDLVVSILIRLTSSSSASDFMLGFSSIRMQIRFYCLQTRGSGASLMAKAGIKSHTPTLYSLSIIQFNGSSGSKSDKDLRAGVALCARAAVLGHVDALRELGHCLQDGYGIPQNVAEGRRFLIQANARELLTSSSPPSVSLFPCPPSLILHLLM